MLVDIVNYIQSIYVGLSYDFGNLKMMVGYCNYWCMFYIMVVNQLSDMYWFGGLYQFMLMFLLIVVVYYQNIKGGMDVDLMLVLVCVNYVLLKWMVLYVVGVFVIVKYDQKVGVLCDFVGYGIMQVGVMVGIQQWF